MTMILKMCCGLFGKAEQNKVTQKKTKRNSERRKKQKKFICRERKHSILRLGLRHLIVTLIDCNY